MEAGLWFLNPPEYYKPNRRFLTFEPPKPPALLPPEMNTSAPTVKTDKYKSGWLLPDAINMSPLLQAHLQLVQRHILAVRDAFAIAVALDRILVLPPMPCLCDRSEDPADVPACRVPFSDLNLPFLCPITHIIHDVDALLDLPNRELHMEVRGAGYFRDPRSPKLNHTRVTIATDGANAAAMRAQKVPVLINGTLDVQARYALESWSSAEVLHLDSAEGIFGGWVNASATRDKFEQRLRETILGGSWCCTSWYKPSGTAKFVVPTSTVSLPPKCEAPESISNGLNPLCDGRDRHLIDPLKYVPDTGKRGEDGYFTVVY